MVAWEYTVLQSLEMKMYKGQKYLRKTFCTSGIRSTFNMKFSLAFVSAAIAGSALARPSTLAGRVQSRADGTRRHRSQPLVEVGSTFKENAKFVEGLDNSTAHVEYSSNWSGAVLEQPSSGYFTSATGRFTVPTPKHVGSDGDESGSAWVGIDGDSCSSGLLQAGIDFTVTSSGAVSYDAWYEWYPDYAYDFSNFAVNAGNVIQVDITATSTTKGTVKLTNVSTGKSVSQTLSAPSGSVLCRQNAEWIVEDFESGGSLIALSNFGTVVFTQASAALSTGGSESLSSATILDLKQDSTVYTDVTINSDSQLTVKYV
ncbi:uncharacterized protein EKO05_0006785 [Ascochyta rabiei]|uniref:uncharacterized protein n=1 Tax=Didymella rabiei TaxID=5454 RepID=UPI002208A9BA|nr:uncharacterized protein EKO05_0006785 [Ascochyta rabiei]UPX16378.1 hypothetical protein EKO05_0006785 [Ascochyta rabiei]